MTFQQRKTFCWTLTVCNVITSSLSVLTVYGTTSWVRLLLAVLIVAFGVMTVALSWYAVLIRAMRGEFAKVESVAGQSITAAH